MAALTVGMFMQPIRWGNAGGKSIICEVWKITGAATAGDTGTITSTNISNFIATVGGTVENTAVTNTEAGVSVALTIKVAVDSSNFVYVLLIGFARDAAPQ